MKTVEAGEKLFLYDFVTIREDGKAYVALKTDPKPTYQVAMSGIKGEMVCVASEETVFVAHT